MKKCIILFLSAIVLFSCNSVKVTSDYDSKVNFKSYKTFAFYKPEIDRAKISDLDKKRILRAIEVALLEKGFTKSNAPDMLVGIFAKSREKVNINQNDCLILLMLQLLHRLAPLMKISLDGRQSYLCTFLDLLLKAFLYQI